MKKIVLSLMCLMLLVACGPTYVEKKTEKKDTTEILKAMYQKSLDSTIKADENKVIGDIKFRISEKEFDFKTKEFIKSSQKEVKSDYGYHLKDNSIGDFLFSKILGKFDHNKLYHATIKGYSCHYEEYDSKLKDLYSAIYRVINGKYGKPSNGNGLPAWHTLDKGYTYLADGWNLGKKRIEIRVVNEGICQHLVVEIFLKSVVDSLQNLQNEKERENALKSKNTF